MFQQHSCAFFCEGLCEDATVSVPSCRCSRVVDRHWTVFLCCEATVICRNTYFSVFCSVWSATSVHQTQLSATDVSARTTMKGAAKCDKHCELQNSVNRQELERILCFRDIPESMPASVSTDTHATGAVQLVWRCCVCVFVCQGAARL